MRYADHDDDDLRFVNCIEQSIVTDTIAIKVREVSTKSFDVRTMVRIVTKQRINELYDFAIDPFESRILGYLLLKLVRFGYAKPLSLRQSSTVVRICR